MTIGVLGGGQLGRMLALAGIPLGLRFRFLDPDPQAPAGVVGDLITTKYDDAEGLDALAGSCDLVTYEFENVPDAAARRLLEHVPVFPPPEALQIAQDRLHEKRFFRSLDIPTAPFEPVDTPEDLDRALARIGTPAILKTRRFGYDGKGQYVLRSPDDAPHAWQALGGVPLILEGFVPFDRELSIIGVRGRSGELAFYPLVENHHREGILRLSIAPAPGWTPELQAQAESEARRVLERLGYVGVLTIELFACGDVLVANEMACRVHNSGHWTIEGSIASQFENHVRAVCGLPLGSTRSLGASAMLNFIGDHPPVAEMLAIPDLHVHLYGKSPRAGRKVGHATLCAADGAELARRLEIVRSRLGL